MRHHELCAFKLGSGVGQAIVGAIISMARSLGVRTLAEGVETLGQLEFLRERGCDEVQGYYFSRPVPADALADLLRKGNGDALVRAS